VVSEATVVVWMVALAITILAVMTFQAGVYVIRPYEIGLKIILGKYVGRALPGLNMVPPFITKVVRMDLRQQLV